MLVNSIKLTVEKKDYEFEGNNCEWELCLSLETLLKRLEWTIVAVCIGCKCKLDTGRYKNGIRAVILHSVFCYSSSLNCTDG